MSWKIGDPNKSYSYVLPILGNHYSEFDDATKITLPKCQFRNCFIGDAEHEYLKNKILLLYKFSGNIKYIDFEFELQKHSLFEKMYEPDRQHTIFVFNVPDNRLHDYLCFKDSKYSKMSDDYKQHILKFFKDKPGIEAVKKVLYKEESKFLELEKTLNEGLPKKDWIKIDRSQEVSSLIDLKKELYHPEYKIADLMKPNGEFNIGNYAKEENT